MSTVDKTITGLMSRSAPEITRVLDKVKNEGVAVNAFFPTATFTSAVLMIDPHHRWIALARCRDEAANRLVLARPRCAFHCEMAGWHVEFVCASPRPATLQKRQVIQCGFPELLASNPRRQHDRVHIRPPLPLRVQADRDGIMPFDGMILDLGVEGIGFLAYASSITLEPGTVLRGCRIELPGGKVCITDLEVRYSQAITMPNGKRAMRSGCRFVSPSAELIALARRLLGG